jgi:threonine dehydratase
MPYQWPTFKDIQEAKDILKDFLPRTPLYSYPKLNQLLNAEVFIKHENYLPTGSFKIRGGINLISHLDPKQKKEGVITASTGNHAQSIALAANFFNVPVTIVMPEKSNPAKVEAVKSLGVDLIFHGKIFDEAKEYAAELADERDARFIHPANEPHLISGVATNAWEILEEVPSLDMMIVPVGGGSGASGCCLVMEHENPTGEVIAVQAEKAPAAYLSWSQKKIMSAKMETSAEGLATNIGYELTQEILQEYLADFILVSESEIAEAVVLILEVVRNLAEQAGASPLAAALKIKERLKGKKVALILTGGNISTEHLQQILTLGIHKTS